MKLEQLLLILKTIAFILLVLFFSLFLLKVTFADYSLLPSPWHLVGNNGDAQAYQGEPSNVLSGMSNLTLTYDLHGLCVINGDASAIIFDQNGWHYISLFNYGTNCFNGVQTINVPLSAFGLNLSSPTGTFHTRFWHSGVWTVDILSASVSAALPTPTPTPSITPTPSPTTTPSPTPTPPSNPNRPDHTIVVIEENHNLGQLLSTGYFTTLASQSALLVNSSGITHPSQPNYYALFSGSTQGLTTDNCPPAGSPYNTNNLGTQLITAGLTFTGFAEDQPSSPRTNCTVLPYSGDHIPWVQFANLPLSNALPLTSFPSDFTQLPTLSFIVPNQNNNAHDGTIQAASDWLQSHIDAYKSWALTHNSLLIVTTDESSDATDNQIYTVFVGAMIKPGLYNEAAGHYNILSTIEDLYGLSHLASAVGLSDIFR